MVQYSERRAAALRVVFKHQVISGVEVIFSFECRADSLVVI